MDYYSIGKKRKISKTAECKRELERIGEKVFPIKLGYVSDTSEKNEDGYIQSILSAKGVTASLAQYLKQFGEDADPLEVYFSFKENRMEDGRSYGDKRNLTGLCEMGFFSDKYSDKKILKYAPILYDSVYSKKQFRDSSLVKLKEELGIDFNIEPYLSRKTAKTYYLDESKKLDLCKYIFELLPNEEYTVTEKAINEVKRFGYLVNSHIYKDYKIFDGMVKRVSIKEKAIVITSHTSGTELKVFMKSLNGIKKKTNILILGAQARAGKVYATNFISYT